MKKAASLLTGLVVFFAANSQFEVGLFAGPQATAARYTILNQKQKNELKYGFQAGIGLKVPFENKLFFAPAGFYSLKGYKVTLTEFVYPPDTAAKDNSTSIHTFELAALLQYDLSSNPGHAFIKIGPSLDFHLSGKEKFNLKNGNAVSRNMKFSNEGEYGHFSANMLAQLGYETGSGFFAFAQYTHGMASTNNEDGGPKIRHRAYGISIGKYLNRKKIVIDTRNKE
ncbi:MAG TPA: porin family protein [Chitinophagaceae bacterium]|nr:porin family protein [Chitinophagaceae bacterium]